MKALDAQKALEEKLIAAGITEAETESRIITAYLLACKISEILLTEKPFDTKMHLRGEEILRARIEGQPLQYILGETEFMSLDFKVTPQTLIPRGDTERIVEKAISLMAKEASPLIADICTGCGNIAVSLAYYLPRAEIIATDISQDALAVARENAARYRLSNRTRFFQGDLLRPLFALDLKPALIISNPPYIRSVERNTLQAEVQKEPWLALDGGKDGLDFYRRLATGAAKILPDLGYLLFETGCEQKDSISEILHKNGYAVLETVNDYGGNHRGILAQKTY